MKRLAILLPLLALAAAPSRAEDPATPSSPRAESIDCARPPRAPFEDHFHQAKVYCATGEFEKAREQMESVLRADHRNESALALLGRIDEREWQVNHREARAQQTLDDIVNEKLDSILVEDFEFYQMYFCDLIAFLQDASCEVDAKTESSKRGVAFSFDSGNGRRVDFDIGGSPIESDADDSSALDDIPRITVRAKWLPLRSALNIAADKANLECRVEDGRVVFSRKAISAATNTPAADEPHAESAEAKPHAETAESAEPRPGEAGPLPEGAAERSEAGGVSHAESAEGAE